MLRPIGTEIVQTEVHDGGTLLVRYIVADYKPLSQVYKCEGALGNVGPSPTPGGSVRVEILTVISAELVDEGVPGPESTDAPADAPEAPEATADVAPADAPAEPVTEPVAETEAPADEAPAELAA